MIFVDSSVWIDYFNGRATRQTDYLDSILGLRSVVTGDLILTEVLRGFRNNKHFQTAKELLTGLEVHQLLNESRAIRAAECYRALRKQEITIRKVNDVIVAVFCIEMNVPLLFSDRDFQPFVEKFGLVEIAI